jgi:hypothetical protein
MTRSRPVQGALRRRVIEHESSKDCPPAPVLGQAEPSSARIDDALSSASWDLGPVFSMDAVMGQDGHACMASAATSRNSFAVAPLAD